MRLCEKLNTLKGIIFESNSKPKINRTIQLRPLSWIPQAKTNTYASQSNWLRSLYHIKKMYETTVKRISSTMADFEPTLSLTYAMI